MKLLQAHELEYMRQKPGTKVVRSGLKFSIEVGYSTTPPKKVPELRRPGSVRLVPGPYDASTFRETFLVKPRIRYKEGAESLYWE